uniref:Uncharacterized protein n=1 Tax=Solanum lycopersicum TaxID=4081 RepID=K4CU56_SOLLC
MVGLVCLILPENPIIQFPLLSRTTPPIPPIPLVALVASSVLSLKVSIGGGVHLTATRNWVGVFYHVPNGFHPRDPFISKEIYFGSFKGNPSMTTLTSPPTILNALPSPRVLVISLVGFIPSVFADLNSTPKTSLIMDMGANITKKRFGQDSPVCHVKEINFPTDKFVVHIIKLSTRSHY